MNKDKKTPVTHSLPAYVPANSSDFIDLPRSALYHYCQEAIKQFGYLDNQGLAFDDDDSGSGPIYIDKLYVLPKASSERIAPEHIAQLEIDGKDEDTSDLQNVATLINKCPRLTLLGDPGVGKTTLIQWLVCSLCNQTNNYAKEQVGELFPLVFTARKLTAVDMTTAIDSATFIDLILNTQASVLSDLIINDDKAKKDLLQLLDTGQLLILVDGLDEVSPDISHWLSTQLRNVLTDYPKVRLLLTSRVVGFNDFQFWQVECDLEQHDTDTKPEQILALKLAKEADLRITACLPAIHYLAPFGPNQRLLFAKNWLVIYLPPNGDQRQQFLEGIETVSKHSLQLNALSRIPVLLNLICFIMWRRGKLPDGRAELYQDIVKTYLVTMDRVRSIKHELGDEYDYQDIQNWLAKLALQMQSGNLVVCEQDLLSANQDELETLRDQSATISDERLLQISETDLHRFLQLQLTEVVELTELPRHSQQLVNYIKNRTGFLIPRGQVNGQEYYGFSHLSFQEYFAAYAISKNLLSLKDEEPFTDALFATTHKTSWGEIWQLVFEELSLTGASRKKIENQLIRILPDTNDSKYFPSIEAPSDYVLLYAKILINPAIKITVNKRTKFQLGLAKAYLASYSYNVTFDTIVNSLLKTPQLLVTALANAHTIHFRLKEIDDYKWVFELDLLKVLDLTSCAVTDLQPFHKLTQLERIVLNSSDDLDFKHLASLDKLWGLQIEGANLTKQNNLKLLDNLEILRLYDVNLESFEEIGNLMNLKDLTVYNCSDFDVSFLSNLKQLEKLVFTATKVNDLSPLLTLNKLKTVEVDNIDKETKMALEKRGVEVLYGNKPWSKAIYK